MYDLPQILLNGRGEALVSFFTDDTGSVEMLALLSELELLSSLLFSSSSVISVSPDALDSTCKPSISGKTQLQT